MFQGYIKVLIVLGLLGIGGAAFCLKGWHKDLETALPVKATPPVSVAVAAAPTRKAPVVQAPSNTPQTLTHIEEGKHYQRIPAKISQDPRIQGFIAQDPGKVQVIEFFSYGCYGCQQLHPSLNQWLTTKPNNVVFYRMPVVFHPGWDQLAKIFYATQALGLSKKLDTEFFTAINQNHVDLSKDAILEDFVKVRGVDPKTFMDALHSFSVNRQYTRDQDLSNLYQIILSPVVVVNTPTGSFLASVPMVGNTENFIKVLNHIISMK